MAADESIPVTPAAEADPARPGALVTERTAQLAEAKQVIAGLSAQLAEATQVIAQLKHELLLLKHWRFGRHSEKGAGELTGSRFAALEPPLAPEAAPAAEAAADGPNPSVKKKGAHGRRTRPGHLPVERVVVEPSPEEKVCAPCGAEKIVIGEEVRREPDYTPGTIFVREYVRPVYACPHACEGAVVVAPPPPAPIEKGLPGPGLPAYGAVNKYVDHLPLARQEARLEREGLFIGRQTQCGWRREAAPLLTTFNDLLRREVLLSPVIHTDDTSVACLDPGGDKKPKTGRLWIYHGDRNHPYTFYAFSPDRRRVWPADTLAGWTGHLQADAFPGYDALYAGGGIVEVACWAHARRKFKDAERADGRRTAPARRRIAELYALEKSIREEAERHGGSLSAPGGPGDRAEALRERRRTAEAVPPLAALKAELDALSLAVLPKSPVGQATAYALENWTALTVYADNGALTIDNNAAERDVRPVAVGRKNYLFFGSERGGHTAATLYSVLAGAKRRGAKPWECLRDLFRRLPAMKVSERPERLPDRWLAAPSEKAAMTAPVMTAAPANTH